VIKKMTVGKVWLYDIRCVYLYDFWFFVCSHLFGYW
jgi:hypothetical protein